MNYADACFDIGFTIEYKNGDTYFRADDLEWYLDYSRNNVVFVRIDEPK